jgi:hypothetical protein
MNNYYEVMEIPIGLSCVVEVHVITHSYSRGSLESVHSLSMLLWT